MLPVEKTLSGTVNEDNDIVVLLLEETCAGLLVNFPEVEGVLTVVILVGKFADDIVGAFVDGIEWCLFVDDSGICVDDLKIRSVV